MSQHERKRGRRGNGGAAKRPRRHGSGHSWRRDSELLSAAVNGNASAAAQLLKAGARVNFQNRAGETPLASSAAWNELPVVRLLLAHGADPNLADRSGGTPLMLAAQRASAEVVRELLRRGADANAADAFGNTVLMHALWRERDPDQDTIVRDLLKAGATVTVMNDAGESASGIAADRRLTHLSRLLIPMSAVGAGGGRASGTPGRPTKKAAV